MKPNYFIVLLICFFTSLKSYSQTWPMPGAHWEYCRGGLGTDLRIFEYTRDTVINTKNYCVIERLNVPPMPSVGPVYTRFSNDTVYRYVQSKEYPFLVFNSNVGDLYTTFRTNLDNFPDSTCLSILPVKTLQRDTSNFGSLTLKHWILEDTLFNDIYFGSPYPPSIWEITERIGFMNDFPFTPTKTFSGNACVLPTDMTSCYFLSSYSDSTYSYITPYDCYWGVGINEAEEETFKMFPNPANNHFVVTLPTLVDHASLSIIDIYGREVFNTKVSAKSTTIGLDKIPSGFYFVKCATNKAIVVHLLVINH